MVAGGASGSCVPPMTMSTSPGFGGSAAGTGTGMGGTANGVGGWSATDGSISGGGGGGCTVLDAIGSTGTFGGGNSVFHYQCWLLD